MYSLYGCLSPDGRTDDWLRHIMPSKKQPMMTKSPNTNQKPSSSPMSRQVMGAITILILALDQLAKHLVHTYVQLNDALEIVPGSLNLVHVRNTGAAFGFLNVVDLAYKRVLMTSVALAALIAIGFYAWRVEAHETLSRAGLALILGGAIGNLIDRVRLAYVIDFIDVYAGFYKPTWPHYPTFNVADSCIVVGAILIFWRTFFPLPEPDKNDDNVNAEKTDERLA